MVKEKTRKEKIDKDKPESRYVSKAAKEKLKESKPVKEKKSTKERKEKPKKDEREKMQKAYENYAGKFKQHEKLNKVFDKKAKIIKTKDDKLDMERDKREAKDAKLKEKLHKKQETIDKASDKHLNKWRKRKDVVGKQQSSLFKLGDRVDKIEKHKESLWDKFVNLANDYHGKKAEKLYDRTQKLSVKIAYGKTSEKEKERKAKLDAQVMKHVKQMHPNRQMVNDAVAKHVADPHGMDVFQIWMQEREQKAALAKQEREAAKAFRKQERINAKHKVENIHPSTRQAYQSVISHRADAAIMRLRKEGQITLAEHIETLKGEYIETSTSPTRVSKKGKEHAEKALSIALRQANVASQKLARENVKKAKEDKIKAHQVEVANRVRRERDQRWAASRIKELQVEIKRREDENARHIDSAVGLSTVAYMKGQLNLLETFKDKVKSGENIPRPTSDRLQAAGEFYISKLTPSEVQAFNEAQNEADKERRHMKEISPKLDKAVKDYDKLTTGLIKIRGNVHEFIDQQRHLETQQKRLETEISKHRAGTKIREKYLDALRSTNKQLSSIERKINASILADDNTRAKIIFLKASMIPEENQSTLLKSRLSDLQKGLAGNWDKEGVRSTMFHIENENLMPASWNSIGKLIESRYNKPELGIMSVSDSIAINKSMDKMVRANEEESKAREQAEALLQAQKEILEPQAHRQTQAEAFLIESKKDLVTLDTRDKEARAKLQSETDPGMQKQLLNDIATMENERSDLTKQIEKLEQEVEEAKPGEKPVLLETTASQTGKASLLTHREGPIEVLGPKEKTKREKKPVKEEQLVSNFHIKYDVTKHEAEREGISKYFKEKGYNLDKYGHLRKGDNRIVFSTNSFRIEHAFRRNGNIIRWEHTGGGLFKDYALPSGPGETLHRISKEKKTKSELETKPVEAKISKERINKLQERVKAADNRLHRLQKDYEAFEDQEPLAKEMRIIGDNILIDLQHVDNQDSLREISKRSNELVEKTRKIEKAYKEKAHGLALEWYKQSRRKEKERIAFSWMNMAVPEVIEIKRITRPRKSKQKGEKQAKEGPRRVYTLEELHGMRSRRHKEKSTEERDIVMNETLQRKIMQQHFRKEREMFAGERGSWSKDEAAVQDYVDASYDPTVHLDENIEIAERNIKFAALA